MTCVTTQTCVNLQPDTMAGIHPQKLSRTKAAARYIVISISARVFCYVAFCFARAKNHVVRNKCFPFTSSTQLHWSPLPRLFLRTPFSGSCPGQFHRFSFFVYQSRTAPQATSCDLPTRDTGLRRTTRPGEIWPSGKYRPAPISDTNPHGFYAG
jgi:hypothetical protein